MGYTIRIVRGSDATYSGKLISRAIKYRVEFDNDNDEAMTAETVILGTYGLIPGVSIYQYNGIFDTRCTFESLRTAKSNEPRVYYLTANFEGKAPEEQRTEPSYNPDEIPAAPEDFRAFVRVSHRSERRAIHRSLFVGFVDSNGNGANVNNPYMPANKKRCKTNSAEVPFLPPSEISEYYPALLTVSYWPGIWKKASPVVGHVNKLPVTLETTHISGTPQFSAAFDARELLCIDENWDPITIAGRRWHKVEREFLYRENGWYDDQLDQGTCFRARAYDPDGAGGKIQPAEVSSMKTRGDSLVRRACDGQGNPVTDPVPLDGNGQPLNSDDPDKGIFLRYFDLKERDFKLFIPDLPFTYWV